MTIKCLKIGELETNCYLLINNSEVIIIDPGDGELKKVLLAIDGLKVSKIIYTHYHFDHTANSDELRKITGAKVLIHEAEKEFINFKVDQFLQSGDIVQISEEKMQVVNTPGHSQGSICLLGDNYIFTGDTLFKGNYGRMDLPGGSESAMRQSLEKLNKLIKTGFTVYPGHGPSFQQLAQDY